MFGELEIRLDPWRVEYGAELQVESPESLPPEEQADVDVEVQGDRWTAIIPKPATTPHLFFVDGVRRIEARVIGRRADRIFHGAFGSFGVGAAEVVHGVARIACERIERRIALGSGEALPSSIEVAPALSYEALSTPDTNPDAPLRAIHDAMRAAEGALARTLADTPDALVVTDGPLSFEAPGAVGFVKRLFRLYLPTHMQSLLTTLPVASRTPLFGLRTGQRHARFSWFVRLGRPAPADTPLAGLVRVEVSASVGSDEAIRLANLTSVVLPRFAPARARDPRAPQNLLPIGALEARLKHLLGDGHLQRRWIETRIAREVSHG
jgi:hypothetical protein